jgi:hypothetical protein
MDESNDIAVSISGEEQQMMIARSRDEKHSLVRPGDSKTT